MTETAGAAGAEVVVAAGAVSDEPAPIGGRTSRGSRLTIGIGILTVIALVAALYLARAFFVPLLIGILVSYALGPLVDWFSAHRVPRLVAAALVLVVLAGGLCWIAYSLRGEAAAMIEQLPEAARKLRHHLSEARTGSPTALQNMQDAANEIQGAATDAGAKLGAHVTVVKPTEPTAWLRDYALAQSALLFAVAAQTPIVLLLTYFLLTAGTHFRRKLVQLVGPSLTRKKDAVRILEEVDAQVQRYLLAMLLSNALVALGTWLAFKSLGLEQAGVWGVAAGILHFIPYLGPLVTALFSGVAAFLQFGSLLQALLVAGSSLVVAGAIGFVFLTWLQSRFASVNPAVLFISLLFFGWLWGVSGLLLGAPLVAIAKAICDRVDSLKPVGELLGR
ncbi:MAG: AI-2E family transporter [Burkholderiales bacterium]